MNRIHDVFQHQKPVFITYLVCGDPDVTSTLKIMHSMVDHGVDLIELGIPFTDPIADGPVIQRGIERALKNKISLHDVLDLVSIFRKKNEYDTGEWESKKNRDYEKYHSEWMSDEISFERKGINKLSDEDFRKSLLSNDIPDYYAILQIQKTASQNEIKNQFRSLAKKWHPDRKQSDDAEKKMAQINMAYEVLSDIKRRKMYDQHFSKK